MPSANDDVIRSCAFQTAVWRCQRIHKRRSRRCVSRKIGCGKINESVAWCRETPPLSAVSVVTAPSTLIALREDRWADQVLYLIMESCCIANCQWRRPSRCVYSPGGESGSDGALQHVASLVVRALQSEADLTVKKVHQHGRV